MTDFIDEKKYLLNSIDINGFYDDVCRIVNYLEPSLSKNDTLTLIKNRDTLGDGLVSNDSLIIHVISKEITVDQAVYCSLGSPILWHSSVTNNSAELTKAVILMVTPDLKDGELLNLENFIENKRIDQVENLVMR